MTTVYLEKRNRIIEFLSKTNDSKILDKVDKLISKIDDMPALKPMTEEEFVMKIEESEEAYKNGRYISLDELKTKFGRAK